MRKYRLDGSHRRKSMRSAVFWVCLLLGLCVVPEARAGEESRQEAAEGPSKAADKEEVPGLQETVVVTAARKEQSLGEAGSFVSVLPEESLQTSPSPVLDQQLRAVPGFSLFRRSSSITSHPTIQGVSLRGIGPSGASRSLVLFDGIPLNDPFGGWVYWNRIPLPVLERVEISRGAGSHLYGSSALGGTIQLVSRVPARNRVALRGSAGGAETFDLSALAEGRSGPWSYSLSGRLLDTAGFSVISEDLAGAVDVPSYVDFETFLGRVYYGDFYAGFHFFHEDRGNGTRAQINNSRIALFETGVRREDWDLSFYTQSGLLESQFSRILPDRSQEFITARQRFESSAVGMSATAELTQVVSVGADWRYARWDQQDQHLLGAFVHGLLPLHRRVDFQVGARADLWENESARSTLSPRAGLLFRPSQEWTLRTSVYRGFRAPTLNELYRPFRVGNIVTSENPNLEAETLWGGEGGADFHPGEKVLLRINGFWNRLENPVGNVTLSQTGGLILRQRQNLGRATVRGLELEGHLWLSSGFSLEGGYLLSDSVVSETGLQFPQVPRHQLSAAALYRGPVLLRLEARWSDEQFEDDLNQLSLGEFAVFGLYLERALGERWGVFFAADNLFDRQFAVGRTPVERLGEPRLLRGGIKVNFLGEQP